MTDLVYIVASVDISGALHIHSVYASQQAADNAADKLRDDMKWLIWTVEEWKVNRDA